MITIAVANLHEFLAEIVPGNDVQVQKQEFPFNRWIRQDAILRVNGVDISVVVERSEEDQVREWN